MNFALISNSTQRSFKIVDSKAYNIIEMIHQIWLLSVCDSIIGKAEYSAS